MSKAWADLDPADLRTMLISLIGHRFGDRPENHIDEIRAERAGYARRFIRLARVKPEDRVVDLGSGCGFGTAEIARVARKVVACDISPAYLNFAREECREFDNVQFLHVESRALSPIEDASVDAIISMSVFIHLNLYDMAGYFGEFKRILRPGGLAVFDFADSDRLFSRWRKRSNDEMFCEHLEYYWRNPRDLPKLIQWNSDSGISAVARNAGLKRVRRRGYRLVFRA